MTAIPRQLTAAQIAAQQEADSLAGIKEQEALIARGQSIVPPEPEPVAAPAVELVPPLTGDVPTDEAVPGLAALRASGMTEEEIAAYIAEMTGQPVPPPSSPAAAVLEHIEGSAAALGRPTPVLGIVRAATIAPSLPGVTPRAMSPEEMAQATTAVEMARLRVRYAEEALEKAQAECAAAVEALSAARHRVAEGFAALMS